MKKLLTVLMPAILAMNIATKVSAQVPTCPIKLSPFPDYNSSSILGDKICPALKNLDKVVDGLGSDVNKKITEVKNQLEDFKKNVMEDVLNEDAVKKFNQSKGFAEKAKNDLLDLIKDKECGAPAAWNGLQKSFDQTGKDLVTLAGIATKAGEAFTKLQPIIPELGKLAGSLKDIAVSVNNQSPEIKKQFEIIKATVESIIKDFNELSKLDAGKVIKSGKGIATGLAPYIASCAACAGSVATAITGVGEAGGGAIGGTAASETGIGAGIGAIVAALGSGQTLAGVLASTPTCTYMTANATKLEEYLNDLETFINAVAAISTSLSDNAENMIKASKALAEIGKALGKENEPAVKKIQENLVNIAAAMGNTADGIEKNVTPLIVKFTDAKVRQISADAQQINKCFDKVMDAVAWISKDVIDGVKGLSTAALTLVNVDKLTDNLKKQFDNTMAAAANETKTAFNKLADGKNKLMKTLLGDKPNDMGAVAGHVVTLGGKINDIIKTASDLAGDVGSMIGDVVSNLTKGANAQITTMAADIKAKCNSVEKSTRETLMDMAKAKAKYEMEQKARENTLKANSVIAVKKIMTVKPLTAVVSLNVTLKQ